jgi:hypothetical protein
MHWIGAVGMIVMAWRAIDCGPDWPMAFLNGASGATHIYMLISGRYAIPYE